MEIQPARSHGRLEARARGRADTAARRSAPRLEPLVWPGPQWLDLSAEVCALERILAAFAPSGVKVSLRLARELPPVEADREAIHQLVLHLGVEACAAAGARGGEVWIRTASVRLSEAELRSALVGDELEPGEYVLLEVRHAGGGPDSDAPGPARARAAGLAAPAAIVHRHGGALFERGAGAVREVCLPPARPSAPRQRRPVLLVVDDELGVRASVRCVLERAGCEVLAASGGAEAIEVFRSHGEGIDLVLLDFAMPGMTGPETFCALRRLSSDVRVIFSSGSPREEVMRQVDERAIAGFLPKPFGARELEQAVARALVGAAAALARDR
jgi:CheY-like chemotaxis protein